MLKIYIPTLNRVGRQATLRHLSPKWQKRAVLVVPKSEANSHEHPTIVCPYAGIGNVRQWIIDQHEGDKLVMLDDDLRFDVRRTDVPEKFLPASPSDVTEMFDTLERTLSSNIPHAGINAREGANRNTEDHLECVRMLRVLAYHVPTFRKLGVKYNRLPVMEDFDVTLQLLRLGKPNRLLNRWVQGQGMSGAAGGCSSYRTMEIQHKGATGLQKLHPDYVRLVEKTTKNAWGGATRTDVVISWKKAYENG